MKKILVFLVVVYQKALSPFTPSCRYEPSCSEYTRHAIERFGPARGVWLGFKRLSSCHPFSKKDVWDPVPGRDKASPKA